MALAACNTAVDSRGRELTQHGDLAFPIACYYDDLGLCEVPWHWHDEFEAVVIERGCATISAGSQSYTVGPGEGFFVNSGILHGAWDLNSSGCRFHSMVFHPRLVGGSLDSVIYQSYVLPVMGNPELETLKLVPDVPWQREALEALENAWQWGVKEPDGYEFRVREALSRVIFLLKQNIPAAQTLPGVKAIRDNQRIKAMLHFIHNGYADEISTDAIAASASVSKSECLRCFRAAIGTTPIQYVKQYRIQKAAQLLLGTQMRVADIAAQCGFQDISYFTKTFRELRGDTPTAYRENHR